MRASGRYRPEVGPNPTTSTGVEVSVVVPSPSSPSPLFPQHFAPPPTVRAQVWEAPATIAVAPEARPETLTGVDLNLVVPFPSWPKSLAPQHFAPPAVVRAHVCRPPAQIPAA